MPKIKVARSIIINKPSSAVYKEINDFNNWASWSPWLVCEKEVKLNVEPGGKAYSWEGTIVGSGEMKIENEVENKSVDCDLLFLKPWKSKAKTNFKLKEVDGGTELTWFMDSSLPFFMFFMKTSMENFIGMDYDRGLKMLKDKVEKGSIPSELTFDGITNFDATKYVAIKRKCSFDEMMKKMPSDYSKLMPKAMNEWKEKVSGNPFSIYHKWDIKNKIVEYSACVPVSEIPSDLDADMITGNVPATKVNKITHEGSMDHIANAWTAQMMRMRAKKFKGNKHIHPMEVYLNSPMDTPVDKLKAEILFSVK